MTCYREGFNVCMVECSLINWYSNPRTTTHVLLAFPEPTPHLNGLRCKYVIETICWLCVHSSHLSVCLLCLVCTCTLYLTVLYTVYWTYHSVYWPKWYTVRNFSLLFHSANFQMPRISKYICMPKYCLEVRCNGAVLWCGVLQYVVTMVVVVVKMATCRYNDCVIVWS